MKRTKKEIRIFLETDQSDFRKSIIHDSSLDEFDKDVLDGLSQTDIVLSDFRNLDKKYYRSKFLYFNWILASCLFLVAFLGINFLQSSKNNSLKSNDNRVKSTNQQVKSIPKKDVHEKQRVKSFKSIDLENVAPLENKNMVQNTVSGTIENLKNTSTHIDHYTSPMSTLNPKIVNNTNTKEVVGTVGMEVFILQYKILDYRHYRKSKPKNVDPIELTNGTPANSEEKQLLNQENEQIEYNYFIYLKETMKLFDQKSYAVALENFHAILKFYPEDINALFYSGLCYFEQKQFTKSIAFFDQTSKNSFLNFKEESEWFLLQCYVETKNSVKAKSLQNDIINGNGFYAKRAKELKFN